MDIDRLQLKVMILGLLLIFDCFLLSNIFKKKDALSTVSGYVIEKARTYYRSGRHSEYIYIIGLDDSKIKFAIQPDDKQAYDYLSKNNITKATVVYDQNAYNAYADLTFHVYELYADGRQILTMDEATRMSKIGLLVLIPIEILGAWLFFFSKYKNQQYTLAKKGDKISL